jgi:hypothetical protein
MGKLRRHSWIRQQRSSSRPFTDIVLRFWRLRRRSTRRSDRFCASPHFRIRFCRRNGLSLRTPHLRKPATGDEEAKIAAFARQLDWARATYGEGLVINMDETSWKHVQLTGRTIAPKAMRSVPVVVQGNTKVAVTAICTIGMNGDKFPPLYVLRGVQDRPRRSLLPVIPADRVTLSKNRWMEETIMLKYLSWRHLAVGQVPCALVPGAFPGHQTIRVRHKAPFLRIELIAMPSGMTGECQPLDRGCFGPLKKMSQAAWDTRAASHPKMKMDTSGSGEAAGGSVASTQSRHCSPFLAIWRLRDRAFGTGSGVRVRGSQ